jgi:hypothetical protein
MLVLAFKAAAKDKKDAPLNKTIKGTRVQTNKRNTCASTASQRETVLPPLLPPATFSALVFRLKENLVRQKKKKKSCHTVRSFQFTVRITLSLSYSWFSLHSRKKKNCTLEK